MKIITVKGQWTVLDGERVIDFENGEIAFAYAMLMAQIRPHKCTVPSIYPVRSLVPHPKKIELSKKEKERIHRIKSNMSALCI